MKPFLVFFYITMSLALNAQTNMVQLSGVPKSQSKETHKNIIYTYTIISEPDKTWGYDIYMEQRLFIHQPSVPALPGNEGFTTKAAAEKVAKLVIEKIKKGKMPPSVTIEELKKLKVL